MGYFKNLKRQWQVTESEKAEMESLQEHINRVRNSPYKGGDTFTIGKYKSEVKKANEEELKIALIKAGIKERRKKALLG